MTLRVQGTISINGAQAKSEAKAVAGELRKVGGEATGMGRGARDAGSGARVLGSEARSTAAELRALAAAERQAAADAIDLGRSQSIGASGVANLTAQFNDIGVMLAAGQNPLQLAIQQGTQITQVFGNMGAGAAVRGLGQALLSMVSPLNLITIGGIAAGAAILQWVFEAGEDVQTLDDALQALAENTKAYADANDRAGASTAKLREEFGAAAEAARELLREEAELARRRAERSTRSVSGGIQDDLGLFLNDSRYGIGNQQQLADIFDFSIWDSEARLAINRIISAFGQLDGAGTLREQIAAAETLRERFKEAAEASGSISFDEGAALSNINQLILGLQRLTAEQEAAQAAMAEANGRFPGMEAALAALEYRQQEEIAIRDANAAAKEMVATLQAEEVIRNQILLFGRDSELVAQNRLAAEREVLSALMESQGVAEDLALEVLSAWDAAKGFNSEATGMPGLLSAAASAAGGIAANIWNAVSAQIALRNEQAATARYAAIGDDERGSQREQATSAGRFRGEENLAVANRRASQLRLSRMGGPAGAGGTSGRGGAAKAAREERNAVADLIEKLEREIELERELDPVKQEMIRHREALKDATAAEREQVEALIVQREREKAATESLQWVGEQAGDSLVDALMGAADAGDRLIETLKRAVLQALLLGSGPLAGLFGGGIFSSLGAAIGIPDVGAPKMSTGGMVFGFGGPTDDKVPRWLSPGEFVVNAKATRRHRHMLEGLNSVPGMAAGGLVGGGALGPVGAGSVVIAPNIDARGSNDPAAIERAARKGMAQALDEYRRTALPLDIRRSLDAPNVVRF